MAADPRIDALERLLRAREPRRILLPDEPLRAAVALVVRPGPDSLEVLLIRRAERHGDPWSGHMAFPGGRRETDDATLLDTAVRETREEVGLDLSAAGRYLGALDEIHPRSTTEMVVSPFAFAAPAGADTAPNHEVERALWIPVPALLHPDARAEYTYTLAGGAAIPFPALSHLEYTIWGMTYRVLTQFCELARPLLEDGPR